MPLYTAVIDRISGSNDDTYRAADAVRGCNVDATVSAIHPAEGRCSIHLCDDAFVERITRVLREHGFRLLDSKC